MQKAEKLAELSDPVTETNKDVSDVSSTGSLKRKSYSFRRRSFPQIFTEREISEYDVFQCLPKWVFENEKKLIKMQDKLDQLNAKIKQLEKDAGDDKEVQSKLKTDLEEERKKRKEMQSCLDNLKRETDQLKSQNTKILEKWKQEVESLNEKLIDLEDKKKKLKQKLNKLQKIDFYSIDSTATRKGVALIISNSKFTNMEDRDYAKKDVDLLEETFRDMNFEVVKKEDLKKTKILRLFRELHKECKKEDSIFFCFIGSHGGCNKLGEEYICGKDGARIYLHEIYTELAKCEILREKPKVIFVQACRGDREGKVNNFSQIADWSDILVSFCTAPHHLSYCPPPPSSSVFVSTLCEALKKNYERTDIETIIIENVHQQLQAGYKGVVLSEGKFFRQCPIILSSLRARIYLM